MANQDLHVHVGWDDCVVVPRPSNPRRPSQSLPNAPLRRSFDYEFSRLGAVESGWLAATGSPTSWGALIGGPSPAPHPCRSVMTAEEPGSVTEWLPRFEAGDPEAVRFIWNRYFKLMVLLAQLQLLGLRDRGRDAEDVALSAFNALCQATGRNPSARLEDRNDLWSLLARCTETRAQNAMRDATRLKRGGGGFFQRSLRTLQKQATARLMPPTPQETVEFVDWLEFLMVQLDQQDATGKLRATALLKLEGYTEAEIGQKHACSRKTVAARMAMIRAIWRGFTQP